MNNWSLEVTTAPASEPLTTAEAKTQLRETLSDATNDTYIDTLVKVGRRYVEKTCSAALITQTLKLRLDCFPTSDKAVLLPRSPAASITSIEYVDTDGVTQVWSSSEYTLDQYSKPARVYPAYNEIYPTTREQRNAVTITYVAGFGASGSDVDDDLLHAIKLLITHWYDNRSETESSMLYTIPKGVSALLSDHKLRFTDVFG